MAHITASAATDAAARAPTQADSTTTAKTKEGKSADDGADASSEVPDDNNNDASLGALLI